MNSFLTAWRNSILKRLQIIFSDLLGRISDSQLNLVPGVSHFLRLCQWRVPLLIQRFLRQIRTTQKKQILICMGLMESTEKMGVATHFLEILLVLNLIWSQQEKILLFILVAPFQPQCARGDKPCLARCAERVRTNKIRHRP